ncbi:MAG: NfeD family protein [Pseudomonadota bacterium]|nr:NfeD family protein [Pseudomonadota bacterium]
MIVFPNLGLEYQLIIFALASIIIVIITRVFWLQTQPSQRPFLNQPGAHSIGRQLVLTQAIVNGQSQMNIDGTQWTLKGPDCAAGSLVKVVGVQDQYLKVELIKGKSL